MATGLKTMLLLGVGQVLTVSLAVAQEKIILSRRDISVEDAFREIERLTRFSIAYNVDKLDTRRALHLTKDVFPLPELLTRLLEGTGHTYAINGKYIVILPAKKVTPGNERRQEASARPAVVDPVENRDTALLARIDPVALKGEDLYLSPAAGEVKLSRLRGAPDAFRDVLIKTNVLSDVLFFAPNLEIEARIGQRASVALSASLHAGGGGENQRLAYWTVKPEIRFWYGQAGRHFMGVHVFYGRYDIHGHSLPLLLMESDYQYRGDVVGAGISYGYRWLLTPSWGLEFDVGIGAAYMNHRYGDRATGGARARDRHFYFGPTALGVKWVYKI